MKILKRQWMKSGDTGVKADLMKLCHGSDLT